MARRHCSPRPWKAYPEQLCSRLGEAPQRGPVGDRCREDPRLPPVPLPSDRPVEAAFFNSLGYTDEDWQQLEADLRDHARTQEASAGESTVYGQKYDVRGILTGPLVRRGASVVTVWIVQTGEDFPRLITAYPG